MDKPIRILILDSVMDRGGAETMTMNYYRNIDRTKVQFDFLVHRQYRGAFEDEIESLGGHIYRICPNYPHNYFKYRKAFRKLLKEHPEYRIIHCNMMEYGLFAYMEAKHQNIPIIISHAHTSSLKQQYNIKALILLLYRKLSLKYITHKFACGVNAAKWVFGEYNIENVYYMHNAIDANVYRYSPKVEAEVRAEFNIEGKFVVGHVGRFFKPKNHLFIIETFAKVVQKDPTAVLMLVGGGELDDMLLNKTREQVRSLGLEDKVIFTGVRTDVYRLFQVFDVFFLPSLYEGFPVVMVEAQAAGLKCIISDTVPTECDITGSVEFLSLAEGSDVWAQRILSYKGSYTNSDAYQQIVDAKYDIKLNAEKLQDFYITQYGK